MRPLRAIALIFAVGAAAACSTAALDPRPAADGGDGEWRRLPDPPLSPREAPAAFSVGDTAFFVGGSDAEPCHPAAMCATPPRVPPLRDGAAYDPAAGAWRRIAPAPVPIEWASDAVIGETAYLWVPGNELRPGASRAFLAYHAPDDRWEQLPTPPGEPGRHSWLVAAGSQLVLASDTDEGGAVPDLAFDLRARSWRELPPDPFSPGFSRVMAWNGREVLLLDHSIDALHDGVEPLPLRVAALDVDTGSWRRIRATDVEPAGPWSRVEGWIVHPWIGGAAGSALAQVARIPDPPSAETGPASGVVTSAGAAYLGAPAGWAFDVDARRWLTIPRLDRSDRESFVAGRHGTAAGRDLVVVGGVRWEDSGWTLLGDAWVWSPPGRSG